MEVLDHCRRRAMLILALGLCSLPLSAQGTVTYVATESTEDPELLRELSELGGKQAKRFVLALSEQPTLAGVDLCLAPEARVPDGPGFLRELDAAEVLVLRGGSLLSWYKTVYPRGPRTYLARALNEFLQSDKDVLAIGGACQFLSGGVPVLRAELAEPSRNPRDDSPHQALIGRGAGLGALFDADEWQPGAPLRLLRSLRRTHVDMGVLFLGSVALQHDRRNNQLRVLGSGELLIFDLDRALRARTRVDHVRLHRLEAGDGWNLNYKRPALGPAWSGNGHKEQPQPGTARPTSSSGDPLGTRELLDWAAELTAAPVPTWTRKIGDQVWTLGWDAGSSRPRDEGRSSFIGLPLSCSWQPR